MYPARTQRQHQAVRRTIKVRKRFTTFFILMLSLVIVAILIGFRLFAAEQRPILRIAQPAQSTLLTVPTVSALGDFQSSQPGGTARPLVGIVAGHKGYDPGAVRDDGLTEAEINHAIAGRCSQ